MTGTLNHVTLIGFLGHTPKFAGEGDKRRCRLNVSTSRRVYDEDTRDWHSVTEWHDVVVLDRRAVKACDYLNKGNRVALTGTLQTRAYTNKKGEQARITEVIVPPFGGQVLLQGKDTGEATKPETTSSDYQRASNGA